MKKRFLKIKRQIRNIKKWIKKEWEKKEQNIIYFVILCMGIALMYLAFKEKNSEGMYLSLGTGIITSLVVSLVMNKANDRREKRRIIENKTIIFRELVNNCIFVYLRKIKEINTVAAFSFPCMKFVGNLFDDFSIYEEFEKNLQLLSYDRETKESKQRLDQLFDFQDFEIKALAINFRSLMAENYLAINLLEEEEFEKIGLHENREVYFDEINHVTDFYDHEVINYGKCIEVLNHTMRICSDIISLFDWAIKNVKGNEFYLEQEMNMLDTRSEEEQEEAELKKAEEEEKYWAEHPDKYEAYIKEIEELSNRTEEDKILDDAEHYINGISFGRVRIPQFDKLNPQSDKVKNFFRRPDIQKSLKKERKKRRLLEKKFGQGYFKELKKEIKDCSE